MNIGEKIRELRQKKHWSQYDLADETQGKVSRSNILYIEHGRQKIDYDTLVVLAKALGVTPEELKGEPISDKKQQILDKIESLEKELRKLREEIRQL